MNLSDLYKLEGIQGLKRLAEAAGTDPQYLRQCATGWRGNRQSPKRPSPDLAARLIAADSRLTWADMYRSVQDGEPQ